MQLIDIVLNLSPEDLRDLSAISIDYADGEWIARLSIFRDKARSESVQPGITMMAFERVPDQEFPLTVNPLNIREGMRAQARILEESGLVGKLDMAEFRSENGHNKYIIKSHAGSQAERTAWLLDCQKAHRG